MSDWRGDNRGAYRGRTRGGWRARGRGSGGQGNGPLSTRESMSVTHMPGPTSTLAHPGSTDAHRRMNLMASVSRSSGLEKDGDDLKNYKTQEEYRAFIQEKVASVMITYRRRVSEDEKETKLRIENQENVLILFRKLREGVASSARRDDFAMEVYEMSLYLAIIFESPKQIISVIPHLFLSGSDPKHISYPLLHSPSIYSIVSSLLHYLVTAYPSQSQYHQHLNSMGKDLLPRTSGLWSWLVLVTKSLRRRDYAKFATLARKSAFLQAIETSKGVISGKGTVDTPRADQQLALDATLCLLDALRMKAADTAWTIIRSAYRELSTDQAAEETKVWLSRSLSLESVYTGDMIDAEKWLESKVSIGYVRRKEGVDGKWIVCKVR